jgi:hypothetical protein
MLNRKISIKITKSIEIRGTFFKSIVIIFLVCRIFRLLQKWKTKKLYDRIAL